MARGHKTASLFRTTLLYWHTLRHMKAVQFTARLSRKVFRSKPDLRLPPDLRTKTGPWRTPPAPAPSLTDQRTFFLLNQSGIVQCAKDWNTPKRDKLWLYNLHYFDDLRASEAETRTDWQQEMITLWIAQNPPGRGNGWEAYPLSLRIVNWIKWAGAGHGLKAKWKNSLAVQVRFLNKSIEWHLLGNHLLANAKALVFAGLFFEGREAEGWLRKGLRIYAQQLPQQILPDGGHFELSPMYHALILEDLLDIHNLAGAYPGIIGKDVIMQWEQITDAMRDWLNVMTHPDGQISFFNDAAFGIAATPGTLERYAQELGHKPSSPITEGVVHLEDSGYIRVQRGAMVALLDVAPIGPDYLPGHAHADTLSFELSLHGQRVIVNSGTSVYGTGPERQRQRATVAHSTVELAGQSSSEMWSGFRVARRARPRDLECFTEDGALIIRCSHDGYARLPGKHIVTRTWEFRKNRLYIRDWFSGRGVSAIARLHLHPTIKAVLLKDGVHLSAKKDTDVHVKCDGEYISIEKGTYHPEFGISLKNKNIKISPIDEGMDMMIYWDGKNS